MRILLLTTVAFFLAGCSQKPAEPLKIEAKPIPVVVTPSPEPKKEEPKPIEVAQPPPIVPKNTTPIDLNWKAVEGQDEEAVIKMYGQPKSRVEVDETQTLMYPKFSIVLESGKAVSKSDVGTKAWEEKQPAPPKPSETEEAAALYTKRLEQELVDVQAMQHKSDFWRSREKRIKAELKLRREKQAEQK